MPICPKRGKLISVKKYERHLKRRGGILEENAVQGEWFTNDVNSLRLAGGWPGRSIL